MRWAGNVAHMGEMRNSYKNLVGKPKGTIPLRDIGIDENTTMDLYERGWEGVDWIHLVQDGDQWWALVNTLMNLPGP